MTFKYMLNPAKVGFSSEATEIKDVSYVNEQDVFIEVGWVKDDIDHFLYIKKDDILFYETY